MDLSPDQIAHFKSLMEAFFLNNDDSTVAEIFALFDRNGNGTLEFHELQTVYSQVTGRNFPESEMNKFIAEADTNKNGTIELNEFIELMKKNRED